MEMVAECHKSGWKTKSQYKSHEHIIQPTLTFICKISFPGKNLQVHSDTRNDQTDIAYTSRWFIPSKRSKMSEESIKHKFPTHLEHLNATDST